MARQAVQRDWVSGCGIKSEKSHTLLSTYMPRGPVYAFMTNVLQAAVFSPGAKGIDGVIFFRMSYNIPLFTGIVNPAFSGLHKHVHYQ